MFTLFDEIIEDDSGRGGMLEGEASERVERRYMGSFSLPFSTVFKEGRIEGACQSSLHSAAWLTRLLQGTQHTCPARLLQSFEALFNPLQCMISRSLSVLYRVLQYSALLCTTDQCSKAQCTVLDCPVT